MSGSIDERIGRRGGGPGRRARPAAVALAVLALLTSAGRGEGSAPTPIRVPAADVVLPDHEVVHQAFEVGEVLQYEFGWKGIPAARATLSVQTVPGDGPARVKVIGTARTM